MFAQGFVDKLKQYLLPRIMDKIGLPTDKGQWPHVSLKANRIYSHQILKVNHTTYDIRRDQDVLHVGTPQCNIMLLNSRYTRDSRHVEHPYLYGKILGIFHADVCYAGPRLGFPPAYHRLDFVWVNWYQFLPAKTEFSLDRLSLSRPDELHSLSFVDPDDILRAVHLIPQFSLGKVCTPAPKSRFVVNQDIWEAYFINRLDPTS